MCARAARLLEGSQLTEGGCACETRLADGQTRAKASFRTHDHPLHRYFLLRLIHNHRYRAILSLFA